LTIETNTTLVLLSQITARKRRWSRENMPGILCLCHVNCDVSAFSQSFLFNHNWRTLNDLDVPPAVRSHWRTVTLARR